jgi:hypothetical protein
MPRGGEEIGHLHLGQPDGLLLRTELDLARPSSVV